jgi:hypothetical protein
VLVCACSRSAMSGAARNPSSSAGSHDELNTELPG